MSWLIGDTYLPMKPIPGEIGVFRPLFSSGGLYNAETSVLRGGDLGDYTCRASERGD